MANKNQEDPSFEGLRILLIDDEELSARLTKEGLERFGMIVTEVCDASKALEIYTKGPHNFDMVITDKNMPYMNGIELSAEILKLREDIPVIIITGFLDIQTEAQLKAIGVTDTILKPANIKNICDKIKEVWSAKH